MREQNGNVKIGSWGNHSRRSASYEWKGFHTKRSSGYRSAGNNRPRRGISGGKKKWFLLLIPAILIVVLAVAAGIYVNDYSHADSIATRYLKSTNVVTVSEIDEGMLFDGPGEDTAMIFYPGAKVEYTAYAPILSMLAQDGIDCFVIKMPGNLAFLDVNAANDILSEYNYSKWYIGGHSLGGAMAAKYVSDNLDQYDGLVLLGAYTPSTLQGNDTFKVLYVDGSEDTVLKADKVAEGETMMPTDYTKVIIEGGNHAGFGDYGEQAGDGEASISKMSQWKQTVTAMEEMMLR